MENKEKRVRQMMELEVSFARVEIPAFQRFWEEVPEDLKEYVRGLGENEKEKIFKMAAERINEAKVPEIKEERIRSALNATIAGEVYAAIGKAEDSDFFFHKALELLREDKIREKKEKTQRNS